MKTVISSTGGRLTSHLDLRFGRCQYFCVYDPTTNDICFIKNDFLKNKDCVGSKVASLMDSLGVQKVISGDFGSKIIEHLNASKIQMVILKDNTQTIDEIIGLLSNR